MSGFTESLAWVIEPPRETVASRIQAESTDSTGLVVAVSALGSAALAECYLSRSGPSLLSLDFLSYLFAYLMIVLLFSQLSRLLVDSPAPLSRWFSGAAFVAVPLHLLLPAALMLRPFGAGGLVLFEVFKLTLLIPLFHRAIWAIRELNHWPGWSAMLLLMLPFVLGLLVLLVSLIGFFLVAVGALVGALAS